MSVDSEIFAQAVETVRRKYNIGTDSIKKSAPTVEIKKVLTEYEEMGGPSVEEISHQLGISSDTPLRGSDQVNYQAETDEEIEAMLPSLEEMKITFGVTEDKQRPEPSKRAAERSKDYDENGIPTVEQMKKDFGINI